LGTRARGVLTLTLVVWLAALAAWACGFDLETLRNKGGGAQAWRRLVEFLGAFGAPDLSPAVLARALRLTGETLAVAVLGTAMAAVLGLWLGACASQQAMVAASHGRMRVLRRAATELARLVLDLLRGVPDFAWAVMMVPLLGQGPQAGIAALALNVGGILGRLFSEIFDAVPTRLLEPLRATGAGRLQTFVYGILPAGRDAMLSNGLLRWECAVRNASVVGVVGGGGLGSEIQLRLDYGEYHKVVTLLLCLLLLTLSSDALSQLLRSAVARARAARRPSRIRGIASWFLPVAVTGAAAAWLLPGIATVLADGPELGDRLRSARDLFGGLLRPDLGSLPAALHSALIPVAMALLATLLAAGGAAVAAFLASARLQVQAAMFAGVTRGRARGFLLVVGTRATAALARAIPDVFWAMLLITFLGPGTLAGMLALAVHSFGILARIFTEGVDSAPLRSLEVVHAAGGRRLKTYAYGAVPAALPDWLANTFFQLEANVRAGIVLGFVGAGGLGFAFSMQFEFFRMTVAGAYLLVMVLLALALDRTSRAMGLLRARIG
jgi:phosphonate transport system permease protein